MKKVILVNPRLSPPRSARLPLSLLALGAALEGRWSYRIVDANIDPAPLDSIFEELRSHPDSALGVSVMPGPQVATAIEISSAVRREFPQVPIVWGGYFPSLYPDSAINAPYVDYLVRGQGEDTLIELLQRLPDAGPPQPSAQGRPASSAPPTAEAERLLGQVQGLTFKHRGVVRHNPERPFRPQDEYPQLPYSRLDDVSVYLKRSFLGRRTAVHQAALGCRYRCTFCGVVSMFDGYSALQSAGELEHALSRLQDYGADCIQFYDHNFFDRERTILPALEVLGRVRMPWWCYARADALANFSSSTWELLRRSRLRMAYIGAESASDDLLKGMRKGTRVDHTLETARLCRSYGIIPEFSFVLGGPEDPEEEIANSLQLIRRLKGIHPECEVILYVYSPTPQRDPISRRRAEGRPDRPRMQRYGVDGPELPETPEEWTEKRWIDFVCHQDAPWLAPQTRRRIRDFATVLYSRFPTVQDYDTPVWAKGILSGLASWRYSSRLYARPWELQLARKFIRLREPQRQGL